MTSNDTNVLTDDRLVDEILAGGTTPRDHVERLAKARVFVDRCAEAISHPSIPDDALLLFRRFEEVFLAARYSVRATARTLLSRVDEIDEEAHLCRDIIALSVIARENRALRTLSETLARLSPIVGMSTGDSSANVARLRNQDHQVDVEIALRRLSSVLGVAHMRAREWLESEANVVVIPGVYDPRRASRDVVKSLLTQARDDVRRSSLSEETKRAVVHEIEEAVAIADSPTGSWSDIIARSMQIFLILTALTSGVADVDDALQNVRKVIDHIGRASVALDIGSDSRSQEPRQIPAPDPAVVPKRNDE